MPLPRIFSRPAPGLRQGTVSHFHSPGLLSVGEPRMIGAAHFETGYVVGRDYDIKTITFRGVDMKLFRFSAVAILTCLALVGCDQNSDQSNSGSAADSMKEAYDKSVEAVKESAEEVKEASEDAMEEAGEAADDMAEDVKDKAEDVADSAEDMAEEASDKVEEMADDAEAAMDSATQ